MHHDWSKPRLLAKLKNITSIAWTSQTKSISSGPILVGTSDGQLYELELIPVEKKEEKYLAKVFQLENCEEVTGIDFKFFPNDGNSVVIYVSTKCHLYQFISKNLQFTHKHGHLFTIIFASLKGQPDSQEIQGSPNLSKLILHNVDDARRPFNFLIWITAVGIYYGKLSIENHQMNGDSTINDVQLLPFPEHSAEISKFISFACTDFYFLFLIGGEIIVQNRLDVEEIPTKIKIGLLSEYEVPLGIFKDNSRKTYWVATTHQLYEIIIQNEEKGLWKSFLRKKDFELSLQFATTNSEKQQIYRIQGDEYWKQDKFNMAAASYAHSNRSFEEIALKFVGANKLDSFEKYLKVKIEKISKSETSQGVLLTTWLLELMLSRMDKRSDIHNADSTYLINKIGALSPITSPVAKFDSSGNSQELKLFFLKYKDILHYDTIYSLLSQHGMEDYILLFAETINDFDRIVQIHIDRREYDQVLIWIATQV